MPAQGQYFCEITRKVDRRIADGSGTGDALSLHIAGYNGGGYSVKEVVGMPCGGDYANEARPHMQRMLSFIPESKQPGARGHRSLTAQLRPSRR